MRFTHCAIACLLFFSTPAHAQVALGFSVQPGSGIAGTALAPAVEVQILDANGRIDRQATNTVTLALAANPGGATLSGTLSAAAVRGVAAFPNLMLDRAAVGYTLLATSTGLTSATSGVFGISAGPASRVAFGSQQTQVGAGIPFNPAISAQIQDAYGNLVTTASNPVTISLGANPTGATLLGTLVVPASFGTATFSDLLMTTAGTGYAFSATAAGLMAATGASFDVGPGVPVNMRLVTQPAAGEAAGVIAPSPQLRIEDAYGNAVPGASASITVAVTGGSAGAVLSGTTLVTAQNGVATFSNLRIDRPGTNYALQFAALGLAPTVSSPFNITGGTPVALAFYPQPEIREGWCYPAPESFGGLPNPFQGAMICLPPSSETVEVTAGTAVPPFEVRLLNAAGGQTDASGVPITITLAKNPTGTLPLGTLTGTTVNGVAQFSNVVLTKAAVGSGDYYNLGAVSGALAPATHNLRIFVKAGPATKYVFTNPWAAEYEYGQAIGIEAELRDEYDNRARPPAGLTGEVPVTVATGPAGATVGPYNTLGIPVNGWGYRGMMVDRPGDGYTLKSTFSTFTATGPVFRVKATPVKVSAGGNHTCVLTKEGRIFCWGENTQGQVGMGATSTTPKTRPERVLPFRQWLVVDAGKNSTCATDWGRRVPSCWGADASRNGTATPAPRDIPIATGVDLSASYYVVSTAIATGDNHACQSWIRNQRHYPYTGTDAGKNVICWGSKATGATGTGTIAGSLASATPANVSVDNWQGVTAGATHTCAWTSAFIGYCWGSNSSKELGTGLGGASHSTPTAIAGGRLWEQLSAGNSFTCGIERTSASVYCWGSNKTGQLGSGTTGTAADYYQIPTLHFQAISAGANHACGITQRPGNFVYCWGQNSSGQIGTGSTGGVSAPYLVKLSGLAMQAQSVSAGASHTCAVTVTNLLYCWGANDKSQLGLGDTAPRSTPTLVSLQ